MGRMGLGATRRTLALGLGAADRSHMGRTGGQPPAAPSDAAGDARRGRGPLLKREGALRGA